MIVQGSKEWFEQRRGKVTASRMADVTARIKSGWGASRANYMAQLIAERLTGEIVETYSNAMMQWGTDTEPYARDAYQFHADVTVEPAGFVDHPTIAMSGASPDGLVGVDGLVEIKCPNTSTHIETLLGGSVPGKYLAQMQWQMACTGRLWCDFVSFDPRMPESMRLFIRRVTLDKAAVSALEKDVRDFLDEMNATLLQLMKRYEGEKAAA